MSSSVVYYQGVVISMAFSHLFVLPVIMAETFTAEEELSPYLCQGKYLTNDENPFPDDVCKSQEDIETALKGLQTELHPEN